MTTWETFWLTWMLASMALVIVAIIKGGNVSGNHKMTTAQAARRARSRRRADVARRAAGLRKTIRRA